MKTGKPTRLSEKLNAELDTIRQDYAASMASQLESFRTDLTGIASDARRTIENDTRRFLNGNRSLFETRTDQGEQTWLTPDPDQTELKTCTLAGTLVICIKIEER